MAHHWTYIAQEIVIAGAIRSGRECALLVVGPDSTIGLNVMGHSHVLVGQNLLRLRADGLDEQRDKVGVVHPTLRVVTESRIVRSIPDGVADAGSPIGRNALDINGSFPR